MKLKNTSLALSVAVLGLILNSTKAQALNWDFSYTAANVNTQGVFTTNGTDYNQSQYIQCHVRDSFYTIGESILDYVRFPVLV